MKSKIRTLIIDDEPEAVKYLEQLLLDNVHTNLVATTTDPLKVDQ